MIAIFVELQKWDKMSFIIDQAFQSQTSLKRSAKGFQPQQNELTAKEETFRDCFWWHMQKFIIQNSTSPKTIHTPEQIFINFLEVSFSAKISAAFTLKISQSNEHSVLCIDLLNKSQQFCTIPNRHKRILVNKQLQNHFFRGRFVFITPLMDTHNGRVKIRIPSTLLFQEEILRRKDYNQSRLFFDKIFRFLINEVGPALKYVSNLLQSDCISAIKGEVGSSRTAILNKYIQLLTLKKELSVKSSEAAQQKIKQGQIEQFKSINRIKENVISCNCQEFRSTCLFSPHWPSETQLDFKKPIISQEEDRYFNSTLNSNLEDKNSNNMVNIVQATIFIKEPQNIRLHAYRESTNMFMADTHFWYICSGALGNDGNPQNYDERNIVRKQILLKKQSAFKNGVKYEKSVKHQKKIIREMKNSHSLLISKYYECANQPNIFSQDLLIEFLPFPTLTEFSVLNKHSFSLTTKMHFIFLIVQALRSLTNYSITHMDLKPNNILTNYFNLIRLVDFGESYHPQVCDQNYKPGFTQPYCAPEIMRNPKTFNVKYDVFALGIIISQLVFQKYPFFLFRNQALESYRSKDYLSYWLGCPEQSESFGQCKLTTVLWSIMNRCLQELPEDRPEVNVLAIIFQLFLQILF